MARTYTMADIAIIGGGVAADGVTDLPEYSVRAFTTDDDGKSYVARDDGGPCALSYSVLDAADPFFGPSLIKGTSFTDAADRFTQGPDYFVQHPAAPTHNGDTLPPPDPNWGASLSDNVPEPADTSTDSVQPPTVSDTPTQG